MQKDLNIRMLILPFMVGIVLGITAKFADGREILYDFPILADIVGRFGIWVWAAALIPIYWNMSSSRYGCQLHHSSGCHICFDWVDPFIMPKCRADDKE